MAVYVDRLVKRGRSTNWPYPSSCHLVADSVDELHTFAQLLGLKREWSQLQGSIPHYDLTSNKRAQALRLGAVEAGEEQLADMMRVWRRTMRCPR